MSDRLVKLEIDSLKRQFKQQKSRAEKAEQKIERLKEERDALIACHEGMERRAKEAEQALPAELERLAEQIGEMPGFGYAGRLLRERAAELRGKPSA